MVFQISREKLADFLPLFDEHKHYRNILEAVPIHSTGKGFVDNLEKPTIILFSIGDERGGECFLTGNHESPDLEDMLSLIPEKKAIFVPNRQWVPILKNKWKIFGYFTRTDFSSNDLSLEHVRKLLKLIPEGFTVGKVDLETAKQSDYYRNYPGGPDTFIKEGGVGFCVKEGEKIVSLVSSIPLANYEIDVLTSTAYRRRGLATVAGAKFIEYCLIHDIKPHWSATNERSAKLALKFGFTKPEMYKCYYWRQEPPAISEVKKYLTNKYERGLEEKKEFKTSLEFAEILSEIDRLVDSGLISPDEPYIKDLAEKVHKHTDETFS